MATLKAKLYEDVCRLSELSRDSAARRVACVGNARAAFQEEILSAVRVEAEAETSLSASTSHRLATMDARLVDLTMRYYATVRVKV
mmetsp:Transcript_13284/g.21585  ORF Transcript_13284/g.21585 Transcript_13284/m.21585 type:complete len:86 (+) Transcript_13284:268-525(+)